MSATRDARTAKRKLSELGITSATVLTGSTTITLDLAAFDALVSTRLRAEVRQAFGDTASAGQTQHMCDPYGCEQHPR